MVRGAVLEASDMPKLSQTLLASFYASLSLVQDLKGSDSARYLELDHVPASGPNEQSPHPEIRPQHSTTVVERTIHPEWGSRFSLSNMHPNLQVLERLRAARSLASSQEKVLLSGLPVHLMLSVHSPPAGLDPAGRGHAVGEAPSPDMFSGKAHLRLAPGPERRVWLNLVHEDGSPVIGFSGRHAAVLLSVAYSEL
mmetsp:Transcript_30223/g.70361  ORF Transcript_30223/g.70361 Transcript_30223/m.70361 type:complete len:196 (+) Transcript_30223:3-590(+)